MVVENEDDVHAGCRAELAVAEQVVAAVKEAAAEREAEAAELRVELEEARAAGAESSNQLESMDGALDGVNRELEEARTHCLTLSGTVTEVEQRLAQLAARHDRYRQLIGVLEAKLSAAEARSAAAASRAAAAGEARARQEARERSLVAALAARDATVQGLRDQLAQVTATRAQLHRALAAVGDAGGGDDGFALDDELPSVE